MPRRGTSHLWGVVRNDDSIKVIALQYRQNANHVHTALIDEGFSVVWDFSNHIAKMNVDDLALTTVLVHGLVHVSLGHLRHSANAEFQRIIVAGNSIDQTPIQVRLINEARL